ncbi:hypothetical protein SDC9_140198 [bioreactor metagenome]|uniref:Uncharacterized protein n=1 Tax=bioreactor metagenome TaxID=1076179 RepID=A0A645DXL0_9ZZZZ
MESDVAPPVDGVIIDIFAFADLFRNKQVLPVAAFSQGVNRFMLAKKQVLWPGQAIVYFRVNHGLKQFFLQIPGFFVADAAKILKIDFSVVHIKFNLFIRAFRLCKKNVPKGRFPQTRTLFPILFSCIP